MRKENELDQLFKKRLSDAKIDHPAHLWDGINIRLDQLKVAEGRKRHLFFLSVALITASLVIGSIFIYNNNQDNSNIENTQNVKNESVAGILENDYSKRNENINTDANEKTIVNESDFVIIEDFDRNKNNDILPIIENNHALKNTSNNVSSIINIDDDIEGKHDLSNEPIFSKNKNEDNFIFNEAGILIRNTSISNINSDNITSALIRDIDKLDFSNSYDIIDWVPKDGCLDYVDKPYNRMFLDILGGKQMTDRLLYTEAADWQENVNTRNETESVKSSYSFGLRFTYMFDRGVSIKSGLLYSIIKEEFKYVSAVNTVIVKDPDGKIIRQYEEKEYAIKSNDYIFYDVPFLISYNWKRKNIFAEFNSGFLLNIYAKQSGEFYTLDERRISFDKKEDNVYDKPFKSFVGGSLFTSAAIGYEFPNSISFFIEPHVRYYLNNISSKSYPVKQKYVSYGMYFGIRYQLK